MADKKDIPKFNLINKTESTSEHSKASADPVQSPSINLKLALKEGELQQPSASEQSEKIHIEQILDDAYAPDKERGRQSNIARRIRHFTIILGSIALSTYLTYAYAHVWKQWPLLENATWYLPFLLSIFVSLFACFKAYRVFNKERSYTIAVTGICIATALTYWNAVVLSITAQPEHYAPGNILWEADGDLEKLLAYEINACRGWSTTSAPYVNVSLDTYKTTFRALPRDEWKDYFDSYLSKEELSKTTAINIDEQMRLVSLRMSQEREQSWNSFDVDYHNPSYLFKLKRALILPYVFAFKHL